MQVTHTPTSVVPLSDFSGLTAGGTGILKIPVGNLQYESIHVEVGTVLKSEITNIKLVANGKVIQTFASGTHLDLLNGYYGYNVPSTELVLHFRKSQWLDAVQSRILNLGCADLATLTLEFDIAGGATMTTLPTAYAAKVAAVDPAMNKLGFFTKTKKFVEAISASGDHEISDIPREAFLQALHLVHTGNVTAVRLELDSRVVWDATNARMEAFLEDFGRTKQANVYHLDWMIANELGQQLALEGVSDFRLIVTTSAADTLTMYPEYLSTFAGI